ncbi:MAG: DUF853 family protein [Christensenellaceae bacterium]|nr:DUF853 family protein [Christensenellaceae bacterium]
MFFDDKIWVGTSDQPVFMLPQMSNRHGLIAGATGTGKTVTLKLLAESFSDMGVPCFVSDVKGDLAGLAKPGEHSESIQNRLEKCGVSNFNFKPYPTIFWDVYGEKGHPVRATVSEMGPLLLARMLRLNDVQSGVLNILFRIADDEGMLLLDLKDLKAMLAYVGENSRNYTLNYGNVTSASIGAIQRAIGLLEDQSEGKFFGEPAFDIRDWMQLDSNGKGAINILNAEKLFMSPIMYSTFLLWLLSELYETMPEVGDLDKPKMVFFFDEAHLLFNECSKELLEKIELVVRLIRSKGVGVYFITQNPADVPSSILGQLGNRVQHALRAYTPIDQRGVKVAADTFRTNPKFDTAEAITQLKTGEALVSFLDEKGAPSIVERCLILPPQSYIGAIDDELRKAIMEASPFAGVYDQTIDRESAYEILSSLFVSGRETANVAKQTFIPTIQTYEQSIPSFGAPVSSKFEQTQVTEQVVTKPEYLVFDPKTGQYVPVQAPENNAYVPKQVETNITEVQQARGVVLQQSKEMAKREAEIIKQNEKAEKERLAVERRQRQDELREERAQRARKNDSIIGRVVNSAVSSVGREVGRTLTRGVLGVFGGKKR